VLYVLYFTFTWKMSKGQKNKSIAHSCSSEGDLKLISLHFNILFFRLSTIWDGENTNCRECFTVVKIHFFGRTKLTKVRRELLAPLNFSEEVGTVLRVLDYPNSELSSKFSQLSS
jgi:hypothetical protein